MLQAQNRRTPMFCCSSSLRVSWRSKSTARCGRENRADVRVQVGWVVDAFGPQGFALQVQRLGTIRPFKRILISLKIECRPLLLVE